MSYRNWRQVFAQYSDNALCAMWELVQRNRHWLDGNFCKAVQSEMYQREFLP